MGMATPTPRRKWDDNHTVGVPMTYVQYDSPTQGTPSRELGPRFEIRVCKTCRSSESVCRCPWRTR
jgi:hypothetical protein